MAYVDKEKFKRKLQYIFKTYRMSEIITEKVKHALDDTTVDAVEVKHGEWLVKTFQMGNSISLGSSIKCSECGHREDRGPAWNIAQGISNYCPNCGAKMDRERKGE